MFTAALLVLCYAPDTKAISQNLHGSVRITGVSSNQDSATTESINQEYAVYWTKDITPLVQLRSALRYSHLGVDQQASESAWRRRFLPSVDLVWNHPIFDVNLSWLLQETSSNVGMTDLTRSGYGAQIKSKLTRYPIVTLRFDRDHTFNNENRSLRDTRELRYQLTSNYSYDRHLFYYSFTLRDNDNRSTSVGVNDVGHLFRWNQTSTFFNNKVRFVSGYNFSHRRSSTDLGRDTTILDPIAIVRAIYAEDASPELGSLSSRSDLIDGNTDAPSQPRIDLGQSQVTHNIGVDFGFARRIDGMYIYTDRPSGESVTWQVYLSGDNNSWERIPTGADYFFNANFNRYEITFTSNDARYIKVVSGGINEITSVLVTEAVPLVQLTNSDVTTRSQTSHQVDLATTYFVSEKVTTTFDITYQAEPGGDFSSSRDQLYYSLSMTHEPFSTLTQIVKLQAGYEKFELTGTRNSQTRFDTWTYRLTGDIALLRSLHLSSSYLVQSSDEAGTDSSRVREQYSVGSTWRFTRTILLRGQYSINDDGEQKNSYRDASASWNISRRLSFGAVYTSIETGEGARSDRYNGRATLSISSRTSIFFNYNSTEFTQGERPGVESYQVGIRSGF